MPPRASASRRPWRTPASSSTRSPLMCWAPRVGRCWPPSSLGSATPGAGRAGQGTAAGQAPPAPPGAMGRFCGHHALLIRLAVAHLEQLEASIAELDTHIDRVLAPFGRLGTGWTSSPGWQAGRGDNRCRDRGRHDGVPHRRAPGLVGGPLPGQQPHRRQTPLGQANQGQPLAGGGAHLGAPGPRPAAATPTCRPSTGGWPDGSARRRPPSRSGTRSWSSPGICSPTTAPTRTWAATTSSGATPIASDNGPSPNSRPSATASSSNPWRHNTRGFTFQDEAAVPA